MTEAEKLAKEYIDGLRAAYYEFDAQELWDHFASIVYGAAEEDLKELTALYPETPESLLTLLRLVDGTYWREYRGEKVGLYLLGSDMEEFPYYLLSARQMIEAKDKFQSWGGYLICREYEDIMVDERVCDNMDKLCLLHFADCCNNGGTSQLYLDFFSSEKGRRGQVLRFLHDPDELVVVADSFEEYLEMLMDRDYDFINEDTLEE